MSLEKVEQLEKKIEQLKAQKQALIAREKEKERKSRTRRLIQIGAVVESRLQLNLNELEKFCDYFYEFPQNFSEIKNYIDKQLENTIILENNISLENNINKVKRTV